MKRVVFRENPDLIRTTNRKDDKKNKSKWRERKLLLTAAKLRHGQTAEKAVVIGSPENKKIQVYPPPRDPC